MRKRIRTNMKMTAFLLLCFVATAFVAGALDQLMGIAWHHWVLYPLGALGAGWYALTIYCLVEGQR